MFYFPKTQKQFEEIRPAVNHARANYNSIKEAYMDVHNLISEPVCQFCDSNNAKFLSFRKGFDTGCGEKKCTHAKFLDTKKKARVDAMNKRLNDANQSLRVIDHIIGKRVEFSNGLVFTDKKDVDNAAARILSSKEYIHYIDGLYHCEDSVRKQNEKECRRHNSSNAGKINHGNKGVSPGNIPWNKGLTKSEDLRIYGWAKGLTKNTDSRIRAVSEARMGSGNPMYGVTHSEERKKKQSDTMKRMIKNGEFTPNSTNYRTHTTINYFNQKFRSSWEFLYFYHNPDSEYETIRIPYTFNGKSHIYIVDFINHETNELVEIRPEARIHDKRSKAKFDAADKWAKEYGMNFRVLTEKELAQYEKPTNKELDTIDSSLKHRLGWLT